MSIYEQIMGVIEDWQYKQCGLYDTDENTEEEIGIEETIKEIFDKNGIIQYIYSAEEMFENPSYEVNSVSVVWLENGELQSILNEKITRS